MEQKDTILQVFYDLGELFQVAHQQHAPHVSQGERRVLHYLRHFDNARPSDISRALSISTARVAAVLRGLERKGEVRRIQQDDDRRCVKVQLTPAGNARLDRIYASMRAQMAYILQALGAEDAQAFCRIVHRLPDIVRASNPNGAQAKGDI